MIGLQNTTPTRRLMLLGHLSGGIKTDEVTTFGNPLTFQTDLARPLKSLEIPFSPRQEGSGDPSPQNIRSIIPWDGLSVQQAGKNLFNKYIKPYRTGMYVSEVINNTVQYTGNENYNVYRISVKANTYYTFGLIKASSPMYAMLNEQGYVIDSGANEGGQAGIYKTVLTTGTTKFLLLSVAVNGTYKCDDILQLEEGETHTEYEPITETEIPFASPVYGGTLDVVSGVLTVEYVAKKLSDFSWTYTTTGGANAFRTGRLESQMKTSQSAILLYCDSLNPVSPVTTYGGMASKADKSIFQLSASDEKRIIVKDNDHTVVNDFLATYGNAMVAYPLSTPQEIQLTPTQLTAMIGNNTIWSDADRGMTAVYLRKR